MRVLTIWPYLTKCLRACATSWFSRRVVDHFVANDARRGLRAVLVDVVAESFPARYGRWSPALQQCPVERSAILAELVLRSNAAVVLPSEMQMLVEFALDHLLGAELKYLCRPVVALTDEK